MTDPKNLIERAEAALEGLGNGSWEAAGQYVFEMHDEKPVYPVVEARGWGYLTGHGNGALGLRPAEADAIQGRHMRLVAESRSLVPELLEALKAKLEENERLRELAKDAFDEGVSQGISIGHPLYSKATGPSGEWDDSEAKEAIDGD